MPKPLAPLPSKAVSSQQKAPTNACDTHVHLLGAPEEYPLFDGRTEDPAQSFAAYMDDYRAHLSALGITRGVVVQSIFYGTDNSVTVEAVRQMGDGFKGIGLLPDGSQETDLDQFADWNLSGVRLNYVHGGVLTWGGAKAMAPMLADRGMHIQMLMHADKHMQELAADVATCPVPVVFDHIGWPTDIAAGPNTAGFQALLRALSDGHAYIKLSGLYRLSNAPYDQTDAFVAALVEANSARCLWGSDWPHIMLNGAEMPHGNALWDAFHRVVSDEDTRHKILVENPAELYKF